MQNSSWASSGKSQTEKNADIIAGDLNTSACRERGKAKVNSIAEAWDWVQMWGQMEDSGGCCSNILSKKNVRNERVARHGSLQNKDELQTRATDQEAPKWRVARHGTHLTVCRKKCTQ